MKSIAQNIKHGRYRVLDEVERDLLLMVKNAKTFNEPKSLIYKVFYILLIEILVNIEKHEDFK